MFSFVTQHTGGTATSIDPDEERNPPPPATLVYFPQNDLDLKPDDHWAKKPPDLASIFAHVVKPSDVRVEHLNAMNVEYQNDVSLEDLVPTTSTGPPHVVPLTWIPTGDALATRKVSVPLIEPHHKHFILGNGSKAPEPEAFIKYVKELNYGTEDGLRAIGKRKPKPGHTTPHINHMRDFWSKLESVSQYWYTDADEYYEADSNVHVPATGRFAKRKSIFSLDKSHAIPSPSHSRDTSIDGTNGSTKAAPKKRYRGFRRSTGSKMPDHYRADLVRALVRAASQAFDCQITIPRKIPYLDIKTLLVPVGQTAVIWRPPGDKAQAKRGIVEGPVMGVQCRSETNFVNAESARVLDLTREVAGSLLLAQERAREGRPRLVPGAGKWYTSKPRWGGGPGGEFGEAEGNKDAHPKNPHPNHVSKYYASLPGYRPSEEEIWRELKPGQGLWEAHTTYLAVGKDREYPEDTIFSISSIHHHVCILRLTVHPLYLAYLSTGSAPPLSSQPPPSTTRVPWHRPLMQRTEWHDLLRPEGRTGAFRAIWSVLSFLTRADGYRGEKQDGIRQHSEASASLFGALRRSSLAPGGSGTADLKTARSHSIS